MLVSVRHFHSTRATDHGDVRMKQLAVRGGSTRQGGGAGWRLDRGLGVGRTEALRRWDHGYGECGDNNKTARLSLNGDIRFASGPTGLAVALVTFAARPPLKSKSILTAARPLNPCRATCGCTDEDDAVMIKPMLGCPSTIDVPFARGNSSRPERARLYLKYTCVRAYRSNFSPSHPRGATAVEVELHFNGSAPL